MLTVDELIKVMQLKQALGIPFVEGACFGVTDPRKLRSPFNSTVKEMAAENKKKRKKRK